MNIHESAEDYLESILILEEENGSVRSVDIANHMNFSKPSISVAMKHLRESGYIAMDENGHIHLLKPGREIAERIYERHKTISNWLVSIGVDRKTALEDACKIEHVISKESFEALKRHIGEN